MALNPQDIVIGKDFTFNLFDGLGNPLSLNRPTSFNPTPKIKELERQDFDGINRHRDVPTGWECAMEFSQIDDSLDSYFAALEALYLTGGAAFYGTVTESVTYANGATAQYLYTLVVITPVDMGMRSANEFVTPKAKFKASERIKLP